MAIQTVRAPNDDGSPLIVIHTGLSVIVRGHLVSIARDEVHRTATVYARELEREHVLLLEDMGKTADTNIDDNEVMVAAEMLAKRAQRFLGHNWTVIPWNPPSPVEEHVGGTAA